MTWDVEVVAINLASRHVVTGDGELWPITNMLDADGEETADSSAAKSLVAGFCSQWLALSLDGFGPAAVH